VGALVVIGRGARRKAAEQSRTPRETDQDPARLAAAEAATEQRGGSGMRQARLGQTELQVSAVASVSAQEQQQ
jgi:hypothetical protein